MCADITCSDLFLMLQWFPGGGNYDDMHSFIELFAGIHQRGKERRREAFEVHWNYIIFLNCKLNINTFQRRKKSKRSTYDCFDESSFHFLYSTHPPPHGLLLLLVSDCIDTRED